MQTILNLVKLEFVLSEKSIGKRKNLLNFCLPFFAVFLASLVLSFLVVILLNFFCGGLEPVGELSFLLLIAMIIVFSFSLTEGFKSLVLFKQKFSFAYLPLKKSEIYLSKMIVSFIKTALLSVAITLPEILIFGILSGFGVSFYLLGLIVVVFFPLIPFGLSALILIPTIFVQNLLKNRVILKLVLVISLLLLVFYGYISVMFNLANVWLLKDSVSEEFFVMLTNFCANAIFPTSWMAKIMLQSKIWLNLLILVLTSVGIILVSLFAGAKSFCGLFLGVLVESSLTKTIKHQNKSRSVFFSYFSLEMKDIFRQSSSAFTYVGMAISMPVMVYFCDKFILQFALEKMGESIVLGVTMLVIMVFISIICSPSASLISKEGGCFWILKTNPNGIKLPLIAKGTVAVLFAIFSTFVTLLTLIVTGLFNWKMAGFLFLIETIYVFSLILLGLLINLLRPNIFYGGKEKISNSLIHLSVGLVLSIVISVFAIVQSFNLSQTAILLYCLLIVSIFAIIVTLLVTFLHKRLYTKMEV